MAHRQYVFAGGLATALGQVIAFTAQGKINRKTASTVGYLSQTLLQAIKLSQHEYIDAWGADNWRRVILCGIKPPPFPPPPSPAKSAAPDPTPASAPTPTASAAPTPPPTTPSSDPPQ